MKNKTIIIKKLTPEQKHQISSLVSSWKSSAKVGEAPKKGEVIFLDEHKKAEIDNFKKVFLNFLRKPENKDYEKDILPMFRTIGEMALERLKYNRALVSETDIESLLYDTTVQCYLAIEHFEWTETCSPEHYFWTVSTNHLMRHLRKLQNERLSNVPLDDVEPFPVFFNNLGETPFLTEFKKGLEKRLEKTIKNQFGGRRNSQEIIVIKALLKFEEFGERTFKKDFLLLMREETGFDTRTISRTLSRLKDVKEAWWPEDY